MTPDQIVVQLKRKGTFDELRKALLSDFMNHVTSSPELSSYNALILTYSPFFLFNKFA